MKIRREETSSRGRTLAEQMKQTREELDLLKKQKKTEEETQQFKFPKRWTKQFRRSKRRVNDDKMLVFFLNKKNEIEKPRFMPIYDGNMIIWRNKPYEFDPRAVWNVKGVKRNPKAYLIKEIDRRPVRNKFGKPVYTDAAVSNMDIDDIRLRGDSTESDAFLIKAFHMAKLESRKPKNINWVAMIVVGVIAVGVLIWFLTSA